MLSCLMLFNGLVWLEAVFYKFLETGCGTRKPSIDNVQRAVMLPGTDKEIQLKQI